MVTVVGFGAKDGLPVVAALDDVLRLAGDDITGESSHAQSGAWIQAFGHWVPRLAP
jgi:hypothetical protein